MKGKYDITEQDIVYLYKYANEGKGDTWISNELGVRRDVVGKLTTKFWERKMNKKPK